MNDTPKRRMMPTPCPSHTNGCEHTREHDEVLESDWPEPYYQALCAYHGCKRQGEYEHAGVGMGWLARRGIDTQFHES